MSDSSEKVPSPTGSDRGLPSLSHLLEFDLIAHAFESPDELLLDHLSIPFVEVIPPKS
jgi:hypothetical protein